MELPIWCVIEPKTPYKPKVKVPRCTIPFCGNHAGSGGNSRKYYIATPKQINYFKKIADTNVDIKYLCWQHHEESYSGWHKLKSRKEVSEKKHGRITNNTHTLDNFL
jgi:hypothetical protein